MTTLIQTQINAQNDKQQVTNVVNAFVKNADNQDSTAMNALLHKEYRAIVHRLFGNDATSLMDKATYLEMLGAKKIGGVKRTVKINHLAIHENMASVNATFSSDKSIFTTYLLLVKSADDQWTIISDLPHIKSLE